MWLLLATTNSRDEDFIVLVANVAHAGQEPDSFPDYLKWRGRFYALQRFFLSACADVICLQEPGFFSDSGNWQGNATYNIELDIIPAYRAWSSGRISYHKASHGLWVANVHFILGSPICWGAGRLGGWEALLWARGLVVLRNPPGPL